MPRLWTSHATCPEHQIVARWFDEPVGKFLDVGCSESDFVHAAGTVGFEAYGIDLRSYFPVAVWDMPVLDPQKKVIGVYRYGEYEASWFPKKQAFLFLQGDFLTARASQKGFEALEEGSFDVILLNSSIEHFGLTNYETFLQRIEPVAFETYSSPGEQGDVFGMARVWELLKVGGVAYVLVPYGRNTNTHDARSYNERTLLRLLSGFQVEMKHVYHFNRFFPCGTPVPILQGRERILLMTGHLDDFYIPPERLLEFEGDTGKMVLLKLRKEA